MATDPGSLAAHDTFTITVAADANPWQNPGTASDDRFDVNDDGFVTAQDVLMVINDINRHGSGSDLPKFPDQTNVERHYVDINGDGFRTASDVLDVINHINANVSSGGEGEAVLDSRPQALTALPTRVVAGLPTEFHHTTQASSSLSETPFAHLNPAPSSLVSPQEKVRLRIAALDHRPSSVSFPALDSQPLTLTPDLEDLLADIADDVADAFPTDTTEDRLFARIS